jgi:hypothetical protein
MKKKESLKELLERLDSQSATYNTHLEKANQLFENAIKKMEWLLSHEKKDIQATMKRLKKLAKLAEKTRKYVKKKASGK